MENLAGLFCPGGFFSSGVRGGHFLVRFFWSAQNTQILLTSVFAVSLKRMLKTHDGVIAGVQGLGHATSFNICSAATQFMAIESASHHF